MTPILVLGDVMLDTWIWGQHRRDSSVEAPTVILNVQDIEHTLGGAGLVACALSVLGAAPILCGVVGNDEPAGIIRSLVSSMNVPVNGLIVDELRPTTEKVRVMSRRPRQQIVRYDFESTEEIEGEIFNKLSTAIRSLIGECKAMVIADYAKGVLTQGLCKAAIAWANERGIPTVVDPKGKNWFKYRQATVMKPNVRELQEVEVFGFKDEADMKDKVIQSRHFFELDAMVLTMGDDGLFIAHAGGTEHFPANVEEHPQIIGAGDFVAAALAACLAEGQPPVQAAYIANKLTGIYVSKHRTLSHEDAKDFMTAKDQWENEKLTGS